MKTYFIFKANMKTGGGNTVDKQLTNRLFIQPECGVLKPDYYCIKQRCVYV